MLELEWGLVRVKTPVAHNLRTAWSNVLSADTRVDIGDVKGGLREVLGGVIELMLTQGGN